jgi:phage/plasmid-associated DNA primase
MNIMINRPNNGRRHVYEIRGGEVSGKTDSVYEIRGGEASGKTDFMRAMAEMAGEDKVANMTGAELAGPFSYQHLEGMRILLLEDTRHDQVEELKTLVSQKNIRIARKGEGSYVATNTIEFIFYSLSET